MIITDILTVHEVFIALTYPLCIFSHLLAIILPVAYTNILKKKLKSYDGTEQSKKSCNNYISLSRKVIIGYNVFLSIFVPSTIANSISARGLRFSAFGNQESYLSLTLIYLGLICLYSIAFYIMYNSFLERKIHYLPFDKTNMTASNKERLILMTTLNLIGSFLLLNGSMSVPKLMERDKFMEFLAFLIPIEVLSLIAIAITTITNTKDIAKNLDAVNEVIYSLAHKNYQMQPIPVVTRNEFGLLTNNLNRAFKAVKEIFSEINTNVSSTLTVSKELAENIDNSVTKLLDAKDTANSVKTEMTNQVAGVEEANATANEIIQHIRHLNNEIENQTSAITQSSAAIEEMKRSPETASGSKNCAFAIGTSGFGFSGTAEAAVRSGADEIFSFSVRTVAWRLSSSKRRRSSAVTSTYPVAATAIRQNASRISVVRRLFIGHSSLMRRRIS